MTGQHLAGLIGHDQIAARAGVSVSTVSRALRGVPGVAVHTRRRIEQVASELGYISPSRLAEISQMKRKRIRPAPQHRSPMVGITDVARLAGVSMATVSRAMRGLPSVAPATQARVQQAAATLGYISSPIAAALAGGKTKTIGIIAPWVSRWFFATVIEGAREVVADQGYDLMLYPVGLDPQQASLTAMPSLSRRVDGILRINVPRGLHALSEYDALMPQVTIGSSLPGVSGVQLDDENVGYMATKHLLDLGHRRIAFVGLDPDGIYGFQAAADRHRGYVKALREARQIPEIDLVKTTGFAVQAGEAALEELMIDAGGQIDQMPTAVVAVSDEVAMGIIHAARHHGISIPQQLSIIGVDNHDLAYLFDLTTIAQPVLDQGRTAAWMLLNIIYSAPQTSGEPGVADVQAALIQRSTTAPPRLSNISWLGKSSTLRAGKLPEAEVVKPSEASGS